MQLFQRRHLLNATENCWESFCIWPSCLFHSWCSFWDRCLIYAFESPKAAASAFVGLERFCTIFHESIAKCLGRHFTAVFVNPCFCRCQVCFRVRLGSYSIVISNIRCGSAQLWLRFLYRRLLGRVYDAASQVLIIASLFKQCSLKDWSASFTWSLTILGGN